MTPTGKGSVEESSNAGLGHVAADQAATQRERVGVVMLAGELGRKRVVNPGATALGVTVDRDRNSDTGAANRDRARQPGSKFRVIDAFGTIGAQVGHLMTLFAQPADEFVFELVAGMIGGE